MELDPGISSDVDLLIEMPVPNSPHLYRRVIPVEPPPEEDEDFETPMTKPPKPVYSSKYEGGKYTSGVEAFLNEDGSGLKYSNIRKEPISSRLDYKMFSFCLCRLVSLLLIPAGESDRRLSQVPGQDTPVSSPTAGGEKAGAEREGERKGERMLGQSESVQKHSGEERLLL